MSRGSHVNIRELSHHYGFRGKLVLDCIDLTIQPGENVALVGRSGCGKSTLLQLMSGLALPTQGSVHIDGNLVKRPSPRWNVMFQKPLLFPWMSVQKNVSLGIRIAGQWRGSKKRIASLLDLVGLSELGKKNAQQLSGGQQQRVALARSLATEPELLLLDEPFSALDEMTRKHLQSDVRRITDEIGITQVIVTHDLNEAVTMGDRVVVMSREPGRIVADLDVRSLGQEQCKQRIRDVLVPVRTDSHTATSDAVDPSVLSGPDRRQVLATSG